MKKLSKQKGYYVPDFSGCFIPFLILCGLGVLGLWQVCEGIYWVLSNISFGG